MSDQNRLRDLRLRNSIPSQQMVEIVRRIYPKYDKPLQSKCESPNVYGVQLKPDALKALYMEFDPDAWEKYKRKTDGHKLKNRISCRLDDETFKALVAKSQADGFKTINDCLVDLVKAYTARSDWDA